MCSTSQGALTVPGEGERGGKTGVEKGGGGRTVRKGGGRCRDPLTPKSRMGGALFTPFPPPWKVWANCGEGAVASYWTETGFPPPTALLIGSRAAAPPTHPPFLPPTALLIGSGLDPAQATTASDWSFPAARPSLQPLLIGSRLDSNPYPPTTATPDWLPTGSCRF